MQSRSELQFWFNDNEEDDEEIEEAMNNIKAFMEKIVGKPIRLSIDQQVSLFFCVLFLKDKATIYNIKGVLLQPCLVLLPLSYVRLLTTEVFFSLDETTGVADGPADNLYDRRKV